MEYSIENYEEDRKIANFVFSRKYLRYTKYKDDLIQSAVISLWLKRSKFDETKAKYFTFASMVCYQAMAHFLRKEKKQTNDYSNLSLDFETNDNSDSESHSLNDLISDDIDFESNIFCENILQFCKAEISKFKNKKYRNMCYLCLEFGNCAEIGKKLGISRQAVSHYTRKFQKHMLEKFCETM